MSNIESLLEYSIQATTNAPTQSSFSEKTTTDAVLATTSDLLKRWSEIQSKNSPTVEEFLNRISQKISNTELSIKIANIDMEINLEIRQLQLYFLEQLTTFRIGKANTSPQMFSNEEIAGLNYEDEGVGFNNEFVLDATQKMNALRRSLQGKIADSVGESNDTAPMYLMISFLDKTMISSDMKEAEFKYEMARLRQMMAIVNACSGRGVTAQV